MSGMGTRRLGCVGARDLTDTYRSIDIRRWNRDGLLCQPQSFVWEWSNQDAVSASISVRTEPTMITLSYRHQIGGNAWENANYPIGIDWTPCNFGGQRPWFLCPVASCRHRVAILYVGKMFACRNCYQLAYWSQREKAEARIARRADRIRKQLGWELGILNDKGTKPKGMHSETFDRLSLEYDALKLIWLGEISRRFNLLGT